MIKFMYIFISIIILLVIAVIIFLNQAKFGKLPSGDRLERIEKSPNYRDGSFQNQSYTPRLAKGYNSFSLFWDMMFGKRSQLAPKKALPSIKTGLKNLVINKDIMVWFGHSSYFIQLDGKKFLIDPVFSGHAGPVSWFVKAYKGSDVYKAEDMPEIDYLIITHDHWDHLDYGTVMKLKSKVGRIICALGVGSHLEHWGFNPQIISELDWYESVNLEGGFIARATPARHFSGRSPKLNKTQWISLALKSPSMKIFIGGDGGYDKHFAEIGDKYGPFDLAILEQGQYNEPWKYIHLMPYQVFDAVKELKAGSLMPVHNSKFTLSVHPWDEPMKKLVENNKKHNIRLITPKIGQQVFLKDSSQTFENWWEEAD